MIDLNSLATIDLRSGLQRARLRYPDLDLDRCKLIGWGAGYMFEKFYPQMDIKLDYTACVWEIETGKLKDGDLKCGVPVRHAKWLRDENPDEVLIVVFSGRWYDCFREIPSYGRFKMVRAMDERPGVPSMEDDLRTFFSGGQAAAPLDVGTDSVGVLVQGPVMADITPMVLAKHRRTFPFATLVLSTWDNTPPALLEACVPYVDEIVTSRLPAFPGYLNLIWQRDNTRPGFEALARRGVKYAFKTRSDQSIVGDVDVARLIELARVPIDGKDVGKRERIVFSGAHSWRFIPYHLTDQLQFGRVADLLEFWQPRDESIFGSMSFDMQAPANFLALGTPESYLLRCYLRRIGVDYELTLASYWRILAERFALMPEQISLLTWKGMALYDMPAQADPRAVEFAEPAYLVSIWRSDDWTDLRERPAYFDQLAEAIGRSDLIAADYYSAKPFDLAPLRPVDEPALAVVDNPAIPRMQIVVPMSGFGERFRRAGYAVPKPLIEIDGKPMIGHIIDLFPGEHDFIFICNQDHLDEPAYRMEAILRHYCPTGRIVGIPAHKLGPVHAVRQVEHLIDADRPVVVNYCDFTCYWDWHHFKDFVAETNCDGCLVAYKGFHPHSLGSTYYAYMRETDGWVQDIKEKASFTDNRMEEYASSGTYYFKSGALMSEMFRLTMEQDLQVGGEYYASLAYKPLLASGASVAVYSIQHLMQWGIPEDVAEYNGWSAAFRRLIAPAPPKVNGAGANIVLMAGLGQRFAKEGYAAAKPLIPVSGRSMVAQATHDLPAAAHHVFVLRSDMPGFSEVSEELARLYPDAIIETVPAVTEGQACSALVGLDALERVAGSETGPVTFGACDNGQLYDQAALAALAAHPEVDVIVWGARGLANAVRHPQMFGWIDAPDGVVKSIAVKQSLGSPATDPFVIGTFTFRSAADVRRVVARLIAREGRVNGEFYLDSCINDALALGLKCRLFEVDNLLSWGTPNDLRTFEYWQSCFHKWPSHPYRLERDTRIPQEAVVDLEARYRKTLPDAPVKPE